ncbi:hypothetical protein CGSMWGv0288E_01883 [Gardnerella vaginalis 0288E]|nr:hypothetical protein CGSMWGv0288E_01883 [Gardnerella vaginalis 0288E]
MCESTTSSCIAREKSPRFAEPLRAEALLLRGEGVSAANPRERRNTQPSRNSKQRQIARAD